MATNGKYFLSHAVFNPKAGSFVDLCNAELIIARSVGASDTSGWLHLVPISLSGPPRYGATTTTKSDLANLLKHIMRKLIFLEDCCPPVATTKARRAKANRLILIPHHIGCVVANPAVITK